MNVWVSLLLIVTTLLIVGPSFKILFLFEWYGNDEKLIITGWERDRDSFIYSYKEKEFCK